MINIDQLSFRYPNSDIDALQAIDMHIPKGALFGLLGPNGAGKTTLISLLCGLLKQRNNDIRIAGKPLQIVRQSNPALLGYIPQEYAFYPNMSAFENLDFFAGIQGLYGSHKLERINFCLNFCRLQTQAHHRTETFSGGLKRRLNIAIGLLTDPQILLFDEPTVGIDPQSRAFILEQIQQLNSQGKTIIYTSHYMEEIEKICDSVAIIDAGKLLLQGNLAELKTQQRKLVVNLYTAISTEVIPQLQPFQYTLAKNKMIFDSVDSLSTCNIILKKLQDLNLNCQSFHYDGGNLEDVFLQITKRSLRD